jgi:hypothetical protein
MQSGPEELDRTKAFGVRIVKLLSSEVANDAVGMKITKLPDYRLQICKDEIF